MRQCELKKNNTYKIAWIPSELAKKDKYLKIQDENGWQVSKIFGYREKVEAQRGYFAGGVGR